MNIRLLAFQYFGIARIILVIHLAVLGFTAAARVVPGWSNLPVEGQHISLSGKVVIQQTHRGLGKTLWFLSNRWYLSNNEELISTINLPAYIPIFDKYGKRTDIGRLNGKWVKFYAFIRSAIRAKYGEYWLDIRSIQELP